MTLPPCEVAEVVDRVVSVGVSAFGRQVGGLGVVTVAGERWSLLLLAPGGVELFTASGPPTAVATGLAEWRPWLERMPFERDLRLVFTHVDDGSRCALGEGRVRARNAREGEDRRLRYRGPGGSARLTWEGDRATVADRRRGYQLRLVVTDAP